MMKTITTEKGKYLIRGSWSRQELKQQYQAFVQKFKSKLTFDQWLVERGKVYVKL